MAPSSTQISTHHRLKSDFQSSAENNENLNIAEIGSSSKATQRSDDPKAEKTVLSSITNGSLTVRSTREDYDANDIQVDSVPVDFDSRGRSQKRRTSSQSSLTSHSSTNESIGSASHEAPEILQDSMSIGSRGRSRSLSHSASESRKHMKSAPFLNGVAPSGRPAVKDYTPVVRRLLLDTANIYENWILAKDSFPDKDAQYTWARNAWDITSKNESDQFKLSERMIKLISARGSRIRGSLKDIIRPLIPSNYNFSSGSSEASIGANLERYRYLMTDKKFHYKDVETCEGYASNSIIHDALRTILFQHGQTSRGVVHVDCFSPLKLPSIALVLTIVEFCLQEWSTGVWIKKKGFDEVENLPLYIDHFMRLVEWRSLNPTVVNKILQKKYDRMRKSLGFVEVLTKLKRLSSKMTNAAKEAAAKELEGRTGDTDSEVDANF